MRLALCIVFLCLAGTAARAPPSGRCRMRTRRDHPRVDLNAARKLMKEHRARNVTVLRGDVADPRLPAGKLDGISLFFVYHELVKYPEIPARFHDALKPDGSLAILDQLAHKTASRRSCGGRTAAGRIRSAEPGRSFRRRSGFRRDRVVDRRPAGRQVLSGGGTKPSVNSAMRPAISIGVASSGYGPRICIPQGSPSAVRPTGQTVAGLPVSVA